ncbi:hypothetical protein COO60DRAFT_259030 [Scenedesmus sp. NREL 46B-D3]|nr:hypothetical protein COO60DRAFT_259030 [Scenedesmus sp. NREL 46B-D3]
MLQAPETAPNGASAAASQAPHLSAVLLPHLPLLDSLLQDARSICSLMCTDKELLALLKSRCIGRLPLVFRAVTARTSGSLRSGLQGRAAAAVRCLQGMSSCSCCGRSRFLRQLGRGFGTARCRGCWVGGWRRAWASCTADRASAGGRRRGRRWEEQSESRQGSAVAGPGRVQQRHLPDAPHPADSAAHRQAVQPRVRGPAACFAEAAGDRRDQLGAAAGWPDCAAQLERLRIQRATAAAAPRRQEPATADTGAAVLQVRRKRSRRRLAAAATAAP